MRILWRPKIFPTSVLLIVGVLAVTPILFLVLGSLSTSSILIDIDPSKMGLANYVEVYSSPSTYKVMTNTVVYVTGTVLFSLVAGMAFAWIVARTDLPFKYGIFLMITMSIAMPSLLQAMAWVLLLSPRMGYINKYFIEWWGGPLYNIYSMSSMIFLEGLRMIPAVMLLMWPLLRKLPASLEETARICGAETHTVFRKILLPLLMPGLVGVTLYIGISVMGVFEIPGIIGLPARIFVFSTRVYAEVLAADTANYGTASALSMVFLIVLVVGTLLYLRSIREIRRFEVVTGKGYLPKETKLGPWMKRILLGIIALYLIVTVVAPTATLLWTSFTPYPMPPSWDAWNRLTLEGWRTLGMYQELGRTVGNTIVVSVVSSLAVIALSFSVAYVLLRSNVSFKKWLDLLAFSPHAVPGVIMGISLVWVSLMADKVLPFHLYGTIWPIALGFTVLFLPFGTRAMTAGLMQLHREMEEVGGVCGASKLNVFRKITFPLLLPTFTIIFIWTFGHVFRMTGLPLMLFSSEEDQVIGVMLWYMWDGGGNFHAVSALGIVLILFLLVLGLLLMLFQKRVSVAGEPI